MNSSARSCLSLLDEGAYLLLPVGEKPVEGRDSGLEYLFSVGEDKILLQSIGNVSLNFELPVRVYIAHSHSYGGRSGGQRPVTSGPVISQVQGKAAALTEREFPVDGNLLDEAVLCPEDKGICCQYPEHPVRTGQQEGVAGVLDKTDGVVHQTDVHSADGSSTVSEEYGGVLKLRQEVGGFRRKD